jgi:hypothetical protein
VAPARADLEAWIRELAALERPSASDGERAGAEWIAARLGELGCEARVEQERAHGGYWWPLGVPNAAAALAALAARRRWGSAGRRALAAAVGAAAALAVWDDVGGGSLWFRRRFLPRRSTWNVVAEAGDRDAERTVVLVAHHDAAHTGLVFHPALPRLAAERFPRAHARATRSLPIMYGTFLGPVLVALGAASSRRAFAGAGAVLGAGTVLAMADIGARGVVPGANDNLSAVATLLAIARSLRERPLEGLRVLLVSTGSEESFMEGMQAFGRRHFPDLDRERTDMLCIECVGSPFLYVLEGEGMLRMRDYPPEAREALAEAAREAGVPIARRLWTVAATDALVALRAGYRVATLTAVDERRFPSNYHWPSDTPDNVSWETLEQAVAVCDAWVRRHGPAGAQWRAGPPSASWAPAP